MHSLQLLNDMEHQHGHASKRMKMCDMKKMHSPSPPTVISWNGETCSASHPVDDESFYSVSTKSSSSPSSSSIIPLTDDEEECVSFLMTLKFRKTNVEDDVRQMKQGFPQFQRSSFPLESHDWNSHEVVSTTDDDVIQNDLCRPYPSVPVPLGLPSDSDILSPLQSYIRKNCVEVFQASVNDCIAQPPRSRSRISVGRVGIRCAFCHSSSARRASQSVSFPTQMSGIYSAVVMMQSRHFKVCTEIPSEVRNRMDELKNLGRKNRGEGNKRQDYWVESAKRLGLEDTPDGIRFQGSRVSDQLAIISPSEQEQEHEPMEEKKEITSALPSNDLHTQNPNTPNQIKIPTDIDSAQALQDNLCQFIGDSELFTPQDATLVPPYLFLAMAQMKPCSLKAEDRVGCYKDRPLGFRGMSCKFCGGAPGFGKYFPATVRSLAQTTTSQTIIKHVSKKCSKTPESVKALLSKLQRDGLAQGGNYGRGGKDVSDGKPKYGSRKVFFQRLWANIHGEVPPPIPEEAKKEEEMSSLGDDSASAAETRSMTTVEDTDDDEAHWEGNHHQHQRYSSRRRVSSDKKRKFNYL